MNSTAVEGTILARQSATRAEGAQALCAHCSEPCLGTAVHAHEKVFCCAGCRTVFEILSQNDLCDYFKLVEMPGVSMKSSHTVEDEYAILDETSAQRQFLTFTS